MSTMATQCTPDLPLLTSLHVSFAEEITTTHLIPYAKEDEKAALYYTKRDLKIFKVTNQLRTQRKIVILLKLIADRNAQDARKKRKEVNAQVLQVQTTESFHNAAGSAPVEELTWKRTCCTKTKDCDATSAPVLLPEARVSQLDSEIQEMMNAHLQNIQEHKVKAMEFQKTLEELLGSRNCCTKTKYSDTISAPVLLPEARGSQLDSDVLGMANTNSQKDNVQAVEFQNTLEEMTWKRSCCTKTKDSDATSAPVLLPEARGFQLNSDVLGMANTHPQKDDVQAMELQNTLEDMTWKRTCGTKIKDCEAISAPVMVPETRNFQSNGDLLGMANTNPQEDSMQAMEFQKINIGGLRVTQEERTCSDFKDCDATVTIPKTRDSQLVCDANFSLLQDDYLFLLN
jgi:hypothetical protein